jgi:hypothetical protein
MDSGEAAFLWGFCRVLEGDTHLRKTFHRGFAQLVGLRPRFRTRRNTRTGRRLETVVGRNALSPRWGFDV